MSVSFLNLGKMEKFTSLSLLSIPKVHVVMLWIQVSFMVLHASCASWLLFQTLTVHTLGSDDDLFGFGS